MKLLETLEGWVSVTRDNSDLARLWSSSDAEAVCGPGVGSTSYVQSYGGCTRARSSAGSRARRAAWAFHSPWPHFKEGM